MKRTRFTRYALLLCFVLTSLFTYAQNGSISGRVTDDAGQPLPGAVIFIKGTNHNAVADAEGSFTLHNVPAGKATIVARLIGYQTIERDINVSGITNQQFQLAADTKGLNEVVVVGYGTQKKSDLTGSITAISSKDFNKGVVNTPDQLISGRVPGVQIISAGGAPGSAARIRVRGGSSLNASNDPLIVVDGVPLDNAELKGVSNPLSFINPNDIESFNILKDASATAIYGSRASNGVIIITTKKGRAGDKLHINFSTVASLSTKTGIVDVLSADEFRKVVKEHGNPAQQALLGNANTNWQNEIYRQAFGTDNNLSLSGSTKWLPYRLSLGYTKQDGIVKTSSMERATAALNLSPRLLNDHLKIDLNVKGALTESRFADQGAINAAIAFDPTQPVHVQNNFGNYFEWTEPSDPTKIYTQATRNPLSMLELKNDKGTAKRLIGNIQFDYKFHFLPELRANLNLGYDYSTSDGRTLVPAYAGSNFTRGGQDKSYSQKKDNKLMDFYLNYTKDIKSIKSRIDVTGGYSYQDFIRDEPAYADLNEKGDVVTPAGIPLKTQNTLISFFGRLNYTFNEKYLLTATVRRDGSSRFSKENRWGTFPSAALAWRINQEPFLKGVSAISDLKLRIGYGVTGQQDVGQDYPYLARYTLSDPSARYQFGDKFYQTLRPEAYDVNLKWEETRTWNGGLDFGFLDGRISGSIDYYFKKTKDLLSEIPIPAGSNLSNELLTNVGTMENKGIEFTLSATPVQTKDFTWNAGFNITWNENKITNLSKVLNDKSVGIARGRIAGGVGNFMQILTANYPAYAFYVNKQVYDKDGNPIEGLYEDLNGDGKGDLDDRYRYKQPDPKVYLGFNSQFNYRKWNLGFMMRANLGNYVYNNIASDNGVYRNFRFPNFLANLSSSVLKTNFEVNQFFSDYYVENASFLRMDNINLAYNFGRIINDKVGLRLSASVQNVFVITKYSGLDPEVGVNAETDNGKAQLIGIDNKLYPRPRVYSLGVNLDF